MIISIRVVGKASEGLFGRRAPIADFRPNGYFFPFPNAAAALFISIDLKTAKFLHATKVVIETARRR